MWGNAMRFGVLSRLIPVPSREERGGGVSRNATDDGDVAGGPAHTAARHLSFSGHLLSHMSHSESYES